MFLLRICILFTLTEELLNKTLSIDYRLRSSLVNLKNVVLILTNSTERIQPIYY